jgi:hypothetical protein
MNTGDGAGMGQLASGSRSAGPDPGLWNRSEGREQRAGSGGRCFGFRRCWLWCGRGPPLRAIRSSGVLRVSALLAMVWSTAGAQTDAQRLRAERLRVVHVGNAASAL